MLFTLIVMATTGLAQAPLRGEIKYPHLGLSFTIPEGWLAQENDGSVLIGSETVAGLIVMSTHDLSTIAEMKASMVEGFDEEEIMLRAEGAAREVRSGILLTEYRGTAEGQAARAMAYGLLNQHGSGVTILALTLENAWSSALKDAATELMESVRFSKVEYTGHSVEDWQKYLVNSRLTFMESYHSSSSVGGASGGYRSQQRIDLCNGWFTTSGSSMVSAGNSGVSGHSAGNNRGEGNWRVVIRNSSAVLVLEYSNGDSREYQLEDREEKLYLNGTRWFRTQQGEYAPACN